MNKTKKAKKSAGLHKIIRYQHGEVIELEYVIRDARVLQIVGSGHHRLHMWTNSQIRTADWSEDTNSVKLEIVHDKLKEKKPLQQTGDHFIFRAVRLKQRGRHLREDLVNLTVLHVRCSSCCDSLKDAPENSKKQQQKNTGLIQRYTVN